MRSDGTKGQGKGSGVAWMVSRMARDAHQGRAFHKTTRTRPWLAAWLSCGEGAKLRCVLCKSLTHQ